MTMAERRTRKGPRASWSFSKLAFGSRVLLGLLLISGGVTALLPENPVSNLPPEGVRFLQLLHETGYLLHALAATEIGVGVLLLSGRFLPLALVALAPLFVNFVLYHVFVRFDPIETGLIAGVLYGHLVYVHRDRFAGLLSPW